MTGPELQCAVDAFVQQEARCLDERRFADWLELYEPDVEYWVPAWGDDGLPTTDPERELSLIYYASRGGLEDRVFRVQGGHSSASTPPPRTCHLRAPALVVATSDGFEARFNWTTHAFRFNATTSYYGRKKIWLVRHGDTFRIVRSHTWILNDLIDQVIDFYHL